jgi:signal peptidase
MSQDQGVPAPTIVVPGAPESESDPESQSDPDSDSEPDSTTNHRPRPRAGKERGLLGYVGIALSVVLLIVVAAIAILVVVLPAVVHGSALTVLTNSMAPKLPPGTLIVIRPTPIDDIHVGQVLTYQIHSGSPAVISHRVTKREVSTNDGTTTFITKGDNNALADPPVREVQVKGTLWYSIPYLGFVNNAVNGTGRSLVVPIIAGLLFAYAMYTVISAIATRRRKAFARK